MTGRQSFLLRQTGDQHPPPFHEKSIQDQRECQADQDPTTYAPKHDQVEIFPESGHEFFAKVVDAQITFVTDTTGLATELILRQGARTNTRESKGRLNLDRDCDRHKEFFWRHRIVRHSDILEAAFVLSSRRVARRNERENMIIGDRLRALREQENLSQGDIEKRTGLLRGYISRVENGHTVPAIETLEKLARAMDTPLYQLFYEPGEPSAMSSLGKDGWGSTRKEARLLAQFRGLLSRIRQDDRELLLFMAQTMTRTSKKRARPSRSA